jgi:hypothetical protein
MTYKGKFTTTIIRNWRSWSGCFDMAKWGLLCFLDQDSKYSTKFNTLDCGDIGTHTFSIETINGIVYVGVDDEKQPITFKAKQETNYWAVENAIKILLNKIHEKSPA